MDSALEAAVCCALRRHSDGRWGDGLPESLGRLTKRGTRPLQSRDVKASTRQRPRRDRVPHRRHRGLHPRFFGHRRGLLGIYRCLLRAWLVRQGRRPSSSRGRLVGAGAGDEHLLVPVPPLGKNRAGRACGLCNVSDCCPPSPRCDCGKGRLRESFTANSPRPPHCAAAPARVYGSSEVSI
jgi:hypothetical protein